MILGAPGGALVAAAGAFKGGSGERPSIAPASPRVRAGEATDRVSDPNSDNPTSAKLDCSTASGLTAPGGGEMKYIRSLLATTIPRFPR